MNFLILLVTSTTIQEKSSFDIISFISSIASLIVSIGAIWLSIVFFKLSNAASIQTTQAAEGINSSVKKLETLFDKLYADTFSMMKDTVSDMRKHIWSTSESTSSISVNSEVEKDTEEKLNNLKHELSEEIKNILQKQSKAEFKISEVTKELNKIVSKAVDETKIVESKVKSEELRQEIIRVLKVHQMVDVDITADIIATRVSKNLEVRPLEVIRELRAMKTDGLINISTDTLRPVSRITLNTNS